MSKKEESNLNIFGLLLVELWTTAVGFCFGYGLLEKQASSCGVGILLVIVGLPIAKNSIAKTKKDFLLVVAIGLFAAFIAFYLFIGFEAARPH